MSGRDALSGSGSIAAATRLFQRFENIQVGVVTVRIDLTLLKCLHHRTTGLMAESAVVIFAVFAVFTHFWKEEGEFVGLHIDQSKLSAGGGIYDMYSITDRDLSGKLGGVFLFAEVTQIISGIAFEL